MHKNYRLAAAAFACLIVGAPAKGAIGPTVTLHVEEPVYVGMPIWFDVSTDDGCLEPQAEGTSFSESYFGSAKIEVEHDGSALPTSTKAWGYHGGVLTGPAGFNAACPEQPKRETIVRRLALHMEYEIQEPGIYRLRWVHLPDNLESPSDPPKTEAPDAQSDWVDFEVKPSSPGQREAWLAQQLAAQPTDREAILRTYIPTLLAAPHEPRVIKRLLDLVCSSDDSVTHLAKGALFGSSLDPEAKQYALQLTKDGCVKSATLLLSELPDEAMKSELVHAIAGQLKTDDDKQLAEALDFLRNALWVGANRISADMDLASWVDTEVLPLAPNLAITNSVASSAMLQYCWRTPMPPDLHLMVWQFTGLSNPGRAQALIILADIGDPTDLSELTSIFTGPSQDGTGYDLFSAIETISKRLGTAAIPILRTVMENSPHWTVKDVAAIRLARLGDRNAMTFLMQALKSERQSEPNFIVSDLGEFHIPPTNSGNPSDQAIAYFADKLSH